MPFEPDDFDDVDVDPAGADRLDGSADRHVRTTVDAIRASLSARFRVDDLVVRTVVRSGSGHVTLRWAADCVDDPSSADAPTAERRRRTRRALTVHGLSLLGPRADAAPDGPLEERDMVVTHYVDWAGVMGQLGRVTGRPLYVDTPEVG